MSALTVRYVCMGCGRHVEAPLSAAYNGWRPAGWFVQEWPPVWLREIWPWCDPIVACSADCVAAAKEAAKRDAREHLTKHEAAIDTAVLQRREGDDGR